MQILRPANPLVWQQITNDWRESRRARSRLAKSWVLLCLGGTILRSDSFFLTHVCATLCSPVTFGPSKVVDFGRQIYPNNRIRRALADPVALTA
jgi:hypothetical protein